LLPNLRAACCSSLGDDLIFFQLFVVPQANAYLRLELSGTLLTRRKCYFAFKIGTSFFSLSLSGTSEMLPRKARTESNSSFLILLFFIYLFFTEILQVRWVLRLLTEEMTSRYGG
jgi:hypothetical protein